MIKYLKKHWFKLLAQFIITFAFASLSFYTEFYKGLPLLGQFAYLFILVILNIGIARSSEIRIFIDNNILRDKYIKLSKEVKDVKKAKDSELNKLKDVLIQFFDGSEIYREKIINYLNLKEDYLCITKSSEGLSKVFVAMEEKSMLPFSKILNDWDGSIKPFEKMGLYLLPTRNLPNFTENNIKKWMDKHIIPLVMEERERFLANLPQRTARLAEKFSFKYIAFMIRKNSVEYDTKNRKFSKNFTGAFIKQQTKTKIAKFAGDLTEMIKAKDFLLRVDWASFAKLNKNQNKLVAGKREALNNELGNARIYTLIDLSRASVGELTALFKKALGRSATRRKCHNLANKVSINTKYVLDTLRNAGVKL